MNTFANTKRSFHSSRFQHSECAASISKRENPSRLLSALVVRLVTPDRHWHLETERSAHFTSAEHLVSTKTNALMHRRMVNVISDSPN